MGINFGGVDVSALQNFLNNPANNTGVPSGSTTANPYNPANYGASPYSSALQTTLSGMPSFKAFSPQSISAPQNITAPQNTFQANAYQAKDMSKTNLPQYDAMRERLNSQYSQTQSQSQDALDRQFAAMGGGPGNGAQAKQTENLENNIAQQKGNDLLNINAQEAQTRTALQQQEEERAFQSGEQQKGYAFQAAQNAANQGLQAQEFNAQQGLGAQEFNAGQTNQANMFNSQMQQQQNQFNFGANAQIAGLNTAYQQSQADAAMNLFNAQMEQYKAQHSGGLFGGGL